MQPDLLARFAEPLGLAPAEARPVLARLVASIHRTIATQGGVFVPGVGTFRQQGGALTFEATPDLADAVNHRYAGLAPLSPQTTDHAETPLPALELDAPLRLNLPAPSPLRDLGDQPPTPAEDVRLPDERVPDLAPPPPALPTEPFTLSLDSAPDDLPTLDDSEDLLDDVWTSADDLPPPEPLDVSPPDLDTPFEFDSIDGLSDASDRLQSAFPAVSETATVDGGPDLVEEPDSVEEARFVEETSGSADTEATPPDAPAFAPPPAFITPSDDLTLGPDDLVIDAPLPDGELPDEGNPLAREEAAALDTLFSVGAPIALDGPPVFDEAPDDELPDVPGVLLDDPLLDEPLLSDVFGTEPTSNDDLPSSDTVGDDDATEAEAPPLPLGTFDTDVFATEAFSEPAPLQPAPPPGELPPVALAPSEPEDAPVLSDADDAQPDASAMASDEALALEAPFAFDLVDSADVFSDADDTLDDRQLQADTSGPMPSEPDAQNDAPTIPTDFIDLDLDVTEEALDDIELGGIALGGIALDDIEQEPPSDIGLASGLALTEDGATALDSAVPDPASDDGASTDTDAEADPLRPPASEFFGFDPPETAASFPDAEAFLAAVEAEGLMPPDLADEAPPAGDPASSASEPLADEEASVGTLDFFGTYAVADEDSVSVTGDESADTPAPVSMASENDASLEAAANPWAPKPVVPEDDASPIEADAAWDDLPDASVPTPPANVGPNDVLGDLSGDDASAEDIPMEDDAAATDDDATIAPLLGGFAALGAAGALWSDREDAEADVPGETTLDTASDDALIPDEALEPLDAIYDEIPPQGAPVVEPHDADPAAEADPPATVVRADAWTTPATDAAPSVASAPLGGELHAPDDPDGPLGAPWGSGPSTGGSPVSPPVFPDGMPPADPVTMPLTADLFENTPAPAVTATAAPPAAEEESRSSWPWLLILPLLLLLSFGVYALWQRLAAPTQTAVTLTDPAATPGATDSGTTDPALAEGRLDPDGAAADEGIGSGGIGDEGVGATLDDADAPPDPFDSDAAATDAPAADAAADAPESLLAEESGAEAETAPPPSGLYGEGRIDLDQGGYTWVVTNPDGGRTPAQQAAQYRAQGFRSGVVRGRRDGSIVERVCLGQFATLESAREARPQLPGSVPASSWVLRLSSPTVVR